MSSNSSLSSAKRRRVGLPQTPSPGQPGQVRQTQQVSSNNKVTFQQSQSNTNNNSKQTNENIRNDINDNDNTNAVTGDFPLLPPPPPGLSISQILSTHHLYVNKMANDFSVAINELGNTFNMLSSNCDNLNDRLNVLENETTTDDVNVVNEVKISENSDFVSLRNDVRTFNERLNNFDSDFKELKESKVLLLKVQGLILDNTLNITNMKTEYSKRIEELECLVNNFIKKMEEELNKRKLEKEEVSDEYISNSLSDLVNNALANDLENSDIEQDKSSNSNISLNVYDS